MGRRISVIGGDLRQITIADYFAKDGFNVSVYGFDRKHIPESVTASETLGDALADSHTIVLGIAPCNDKMTLVTPYWSDSISATSLISHLTPGSTVIGGKLPQGFIKLCDDAGIRTIDYADREDFAVSNAIPTAEGALAIAMNELPFTLHNSNCLVTGFGRIGKILARYLSALGANVTCTARKHSDLAWIDALGYTPVHTNNLYTTVYDFNIIFNTIPKHIFDHNILRNVRPGTLIIDLASKPGGVDLESASALGIKVVWALSLPGKVAPATAGKIIKNTVANILSEI